MLLRHVARSPDLHLSYLTLYVWRNNRGLEGPQPLTAALRAQFPVADFNQPSVGGGHLLSHENKQGFERRDADFGGYMWMSVFSFVKGYAEVKSFCGVRVCFYVCVWRRQRWGTNVAESVD